LWGQHVSYSSLGRDQTILTITDPLGKMPWLVKLYDGNVQRASISRDGKWLLTIVDQAGPEGSPEQAVYAQSLEVTWNPHYGEVMHERVMLDSISTVAGSDSHISASFLPSDGAPVRVAVDRIEDGLENITIHGMGENEAGQVWYYNPATPTSGDRAGFSAGADMLASPRHYGQQTILELYDLARSSFRQEFDVPLPSRDDQPVQLQFTPLKNNVLVTIQKYRAMSIVLMQDVYTVPIDRNGSPGTPQFIAHSLFNGYPTVAPAPGGSLLAYINDRKVLHVTGYDGTGDRPVANGVTGLWSLNTETDLSWAR